MKAIFVLASLIAATTASPQILYNGLGGLNALHPGYGYGYGYAGALTYASAPIVSAPGVLPITAATKTQYHAQDELGQAAFGHSEPSQSHAAVRDSAGGVRGTFSYISPEGIPFRTDYVADHNGYRAASNAFPVDTPAVQAAKIDHAAAHARALVRTKRALVYSAGAPVLAHHGLHHLGYSAIAAPAAVTYTAPALTYAAQPAAAITYNAAPALTYAAAAPAATVLASPAVRAATLTRVVNTPGHAVSYRVD